MEFVRPWDKRKIIMEKNEGDYLVERGSFIPAKNQIENLMLAGKNLEVYRREYYDFGPDEEDDGRMDPTRRTNYDLADAHADKVALEARLLAQQAAAKKKKEFEEAKPEEKSTAAEGE